MLKYIINKLKENRGNIGALFGGKSDNQVANIPIPQFQTDPNFTSSQNSLATLGQNVLSGNLPAFYSSLGKSNSPQFQSMLTNVEGQTNQNSQAAEAASGTARSGVGEAASALALNNVIPGLSYQDFTNAQTQQEGLLNFGSGLTQDVAGNALTNQEQENTFSQQNFTDQLNQSEYNNTYNANAAAQKGQAIGSLFSAGADIGLAPFTGGATLAGLPGALGSAGASNGNSSGFASLISSLGSIGSNIGGGNSLSSSGVPSVNQWANYYGA